MNRREFLKLTGFTTAGITLGALARKYILPYEKINETWKEGIEKWKLSICGECPAGCGVRVRLIDEFPVKLEGNKHCPVSRGTLCSKGQSALDVLYDPDRIVGPVKRVGTRGKGEWKRIEWNEAINTVVTKLTELRKHEKPNSLALITDPQNNVTKLLFKHFMNAYGSPNMIEFGGLRDPGIIANGVLTPMGYDIENTSYILSFGCPILEFWYSPVWVHRAYGSFRRKYAEKRGKLVQIEPRLSLTASKADEWISIVPGTEGVLALGIAHIIIRERLYDENFIRRNTLQFEDWKSLVLENYIPETVSSITGVSVPTIIRLAREFTSRKPVLAIAETTGTLTKGTFTHWAVYCLNALVGSINTSGGIVTPDYAPVSQLPETKSNTITHKGLINPDTILKDPIKVLILTQINPLFESFKPDQWQKVLEQIPFIISFSPYLNESTIYADIILPDHTPLEKWQDTIESVPPGYPRFGANAPAVKPILDTKQTAEIIIMIAKEIGTPLAELFPWRNFPEALRYVAKGLYESRRGTLYTTSFEASWVREMEKGGWWSPIASTFDEFWEKLLETGGWLDPILDFSEEKRTLIKFTSYDIVQHTKKVESQKDYPIWLYPFETRITGSYDSNQPLLFELIGQHVNVEWDSWAELHPDTARSLGISDGDWIWIESSSAKVKLKARLYIGTRPDVVNIPLGFGHTIGGRWTKEIGINVMKLVTSEPDPLSGYALSHGTKVRISKA